ncbi:MAG: polyphosphate polymerase domain-containing protein [Rikenellaceae bacterium]
MCVDQAINNFEAISLEAMEGVKLMNRTDRKYWFSVDLLASLLAEVSDQYYLMEIKGERNMAYSTIYYDTPENQMYNNHHRGKLNRYKIRRRSYVSSQTSFLEIKFKSNKGRTMKVRRVCDYHNEGFGEQEATFIAAKSPYQCDMLRRALVTKFNRLMLVSKAMNERCTIDSSLQFCGNENSVSLDALVIVEVKSDGKSYSPIIEALNRRRLKPSGFSKYCIGRSITDPTLRHNRFKVKHRELEKRVEIINLKENKNGVDREFRVSGY